ncbi:TonB family protein [Burkholderia anthina]|uniref:TonB family protein n=1 Tax=Burkholderia anthina TaxID=179879 RepID=UPI0037BF12FC
MSRSKHAFSAAVAVFATLAGTAHAEVSYVYASEVARCKPVAAREVTYPGDARRAGHQGKVTVGFVLLPDGTLSDTTLLTSSGHAELDAAATAALTRMQCAADEQAQPIRVKETVTYLLDE